MGTTGLLCTRRAPPILVPLLIGAGIVGSPALGTAALIAEDHNLQVLSEQTERDISHLHSSIASLQNQAGRLAETVLQIWHGLDLLFFRTEIYAWPREKHVAFMPNIAGIIKETRGKVKENLFPREEKRK